MSSWVIFGIFWRLAERKVFYVVECEMMTCACFSVNILKGWDVLEEIWRRAKWKRRRENEIEMRGRGVDMEYFDGAAVWFC